MTNYTYELLDGMIWRENKRKGEKGGLGALFGSFLKKERKERGEVGG